MGNRYEETWIGDWRELYPFGNKGPGSNSLIAGVLLSPERNQFQTNQVATDPLAEYRCFPKQGVLIHIGLSMLFQGLDDYTGV